jgi:hypothetical protein
MGMECNGVGSGTVECGEGRRAHVSAGRDDAQKLALKRFKRNHVLPPRQKHRARPN